MTSASQYQREADVARVGLAETLAQLRDGATPSALSGEALALAKDSGLSMLRTLADQVRANPVPALLIGAGLTMLLTHTTGGDVVKAAGSTVKSAAAKGAEAARGAASTMASAAASTADAAREMAADAAVRVADSVAGAAVAANDRLSGTMASGRESATAGVEAAKEKLQSGLEAGKVALDTGRQQAGAAADKLADQAQTFAEEARQSFARLIDEQPILMAALGAALGAAVGAALPLTQAEKNVLSEPGAKALGAGRDTLSNAAEVVRQEVNAAEIGAKMSDIAEKVAQNVGGNERGR